MKFLTSVGRLYLFVDINFATVLASSFHTVHTVIKVNRFVQIVSELQMVIFMGEYNIPAVVLFINFKKAYDSVKRSKVIEAMEEFGIPAKLQ